MHVVFLIEVAAERIMSRGSPARLTVLSLIFLISHPVDTLARLDPNVFSTELFRAEVLHKVFTCDETAFFIRIFQQDLIELLDNGLHDFLEASGHRFFLLSIRTDVLAELLINLLYDTTQPILHVLVSELDLLVHLNSLFV